MLEGVTGFAVDGTSPSAVARAVITLLSDSQLAQRMGAQGRQWVIDEWRWSLWAERFARLLR